jgi:hypothetical protein
VTLRRPPSTPIHIHVRFLAKSSLFGPDYGSERSVGPFVRRRRYKAGRRRIDAVIFRVSGCGSDGTLMCRPPRKRIITNDIDAVTASMRRRAKKATAPTAVELTAPPFLATVPLSRRATTPSSTTKSATMIKLLLRVHVAIPAELTAATDWQPRVPFRLMQDRADHCPGRPQERGISLT